MGLVEDLLSSRDNTYSSAIRVELAKQARVRKENYLWKGRLPVSAFESYNCCPKTLIENQKKSRWFKTTTLEKMNLGKVIHRMYQEAALDTPNLKFIKPYHIPNHLKERLDKVWPEIPVAFLDKETNEVVISGIADEVENLLGAPTPLDIKSNNDDPRIFTNEFDKKILKEKHIIQVKFYGYLMNLDKYYSPFTIKQVKLLYVNTRMRKEEDFEVEKYYFLSDEDNTKFELLCKESMYQIRAEKSKIDSRCSYRYCSIHA